MQDRVIADMRRWLDAGIDFGHVALNAAAAEFRQNDFAERLLGNLHAAKVPAHFLELEVTETVFLGRGAEYVERALKLLNSHGVRIALDDRSEEHTSELQSLMRISYAVFCLKKKIPVATVCINTQRRLS